MDDDRIILFAEDDENEAYLFKAALEMAGVRNPVLHLLDGQDVIEHLKTLSVSSDRNAHPWPVVLVTDLKMVRFSGFDVLLWIQEYLSPCPFPKVVMTASPDPADKDEALRLGADAYWLKPIELHDLVQLARELHDSFMGRAAGK